MVASALALVAFPLSAAPTPSDAKLDASGLLSSCISPAGTPAHTACLLIVGSFMDGVNAAAITARSQHKQPAICLPPELDRETVIAKLAYAMGSVQGAVDRQVAAVVRGALLASSYPFS